MTLLADTLRSYPISQLLAIPSVDHTGISDTFLPTHQSPIATDKLHRVVCSQNEKYYTVSRVIQGLY